MSKDETRTKVVEAAVDWRLKTLRPDGTNPLPAEEPERSLAQAVDAHLKSLSDEAMRKVTDGRPTAWSHVLDSNPTDSNDE